MMTTTPPGDRLEKWDRKFNVERVKEILEEAKPTMKNRARQMFLQQARIENATKNVMGDFGAVIKDTVSYLNFARQLWKADRTYSSKMLRMAAQELIEKWERRGLDPVVLVAIRDRVFTIPAPTGP